MGVINLTSDSFYAGSRYMNIKLARKHVEDMIREGADIIDIGAMSSRPGAKLSSPEQELKTVLPLLQEVRDMEVLFSIDTIHSEVAEHCLRAGAHMINDISAGEYDPKLIRVVSDWGAILVAMHMRGTPETMNQLTNYPIGVTAEILAYFHDRLKFLSKSGVKDIIIDPGLGFSKTVKQNYELLRNLSAFRMLDRPILIGTSRKSMIWRTLGVTPKEALNGTIAANMMALNNGADVLRVHDVKAAVETVKIWNAYCS